MSWWWSSPSYCKLLRIELIHFSLKRESKPFSTACPICLVRSHWILWITARKIGMRSLTTEDVRSAWELREWWPRWRLRFVDRSEGTARDLQTAFQLFLLYFLTVDWLFVLFFGASESLWGEKMLLFICTFEPTTIIIIIFTSLLSVRVLHGMDGVGVVNGTDDVGVLHGTDGVGVVHSTDGVGVVHGTDGVGLVDGMDREQWCVLGLGPCLSLPVLKDRSSSPWPWPWPWTPSPWPWPWYPSPWPWPWYPSPWPWPWNPSPW